MAKVVPTVLATTPAEYKTMIERAESLSKRVHVDICDGQFADNQTVGLSQVYVSEGVELDLHLMLDDPTPQLESALALKPSLIIFHAESQGDLEELTRRCQELGIKAGVAVLPDTEIDEVAECIEVADHVLVFTGELGRNGGQFQKEQLSKCDEIRDIKADIEISVDGGVSAANAGEVANAGVDVLYVGSALQAAKNPPEAYGALTEAAS